METEKIEETMNNLCTNGLVSVIKGMARITVNKEFHFFENNKNQQLPMSSWCCAVMDSTHRIQPQQHGELLWAASRCLHSDTDFHLEWCLWELELQNPDFLSGQIKVTCTLTGPKVHLGRPF